MKTRALITAVLLFASSAALASRGKTFRVEEQFPLGVDGTLVLDNAIGNIEVEGVDGKGVSVDVLKTVVAADDDGIEEGRDMTQLVVGGNENTRVLRTFMSPQPRAKQWRSTVHWRVRMPKSANLRLSSSTSSQMHVSGMRGNVFARNFNGTITLENCTGLVNADSVNGSILFSAPSIQKETSLSTLNGVVTVRVRSDSDLRWIAETIRGDIRTNLPVRGMFLGPSFKGSVNAPGGPRLHTMALTGTINLIGSDIPMTALQSLRNVPTIDIPPEQAKSVVGDYRRGVVTQSVAYHTIAGEIQIGEVQGAADLTTEAGKVQLGSVLGDATVHSRGGSLQLGEIFGTLRASTRAGDIFVEAARRGGIIETTGGTIRLLYTGGPTRLVTGGGDVLVRQARGPVHASTKSGDVNITVDRVSKKQTIKAETGKGNIILNVDPQFGGDFDLTILTDDPTAHTIQSELSGLTISRDEFDGRTRIRATGRISGGGEKVTLQATDGSIRIVTALSGPALFGR